MALLLLHERDVKGPESNIRNYVSDLMAINIDTPVEWSEQQIRELQYSHLESLVHHQKASWQGHYEAVNAASESEILRKGFMWAMQAVRFLRMDGETKACNDSYFSWGSDDKINLLRPLQW
jgi:hypothetical protein